MSATARTHRVEPSCLFPDETEIARLVLQHLARPRHGWVWPRCWSAKGSPGAIRCSATDATCRPCWPTCSVGTACRRQRRALRRTARRTGLERELSLSPAVRFSVLKSRRAQPEIMPRSSSAT